MRKLIAFLISILAIMGFTQCTSGEKLTAEEQALLSAVNDAVVESFASKEDIVNARELFAEAINKGLLDTDSLVLVETIADDGVYQCVTYVYHNKMITFHNAKKEDRLSGEFTQVQVTDTPYEALTFLDAIQMNKFDNFLRARTKDIPESDDWWLITFVSKNGEAYSAKNYYSR